MQQRRTVSWRPSASRRVHSIGGQTPRPACLPNQRSGPACMPTLAFPPHRGAFAEPIDTSGAVTPTDPFGHLPRRGPDTPVADLTLERQSRSGFRGAEPQPAELPAVSSDRQGPPPSHEIRAPFRDRVRERLMDETGTFVSFCNLLDLLSDGEDGDVVSEEARRWSDSVADPLVPCPEVCLGPRARCRCPGGLQVYQQAEVLLAKHPDLLEEFGAILPEGSMPPKGPAAPQEPSPQTRAIPDAEVKQGLRMSPLPRCRFGPRGALAQESCRARVIKLSPILQDWEAAPPTAARLLNATPPRAGSLRFAPSVQQEEVERTRTSTTSDPASTPLTNRVSQALTPKPRVRTGTRQVSSRGSLDRAWGIDPLLIVQRPPHTHTPQRSNSFRSSSEFSPRSSVGPGPADAPQAIALPATSATARFGPPGSALASRSLLLDSFDPHQDERPTAITENLDDVVENLIFRDTYMS